MRKSVLVLLTALATAVSATASDYTLPFSFTPSEEALAECEVIDVLGDASAGYGGDIYGGWGFSGNPKFAFKYTYSMDNKADDWLILPAVDFGDCTKVKVSFQIETYSDKEDFEVALGHDRTAEGMNQTVMTRTDFSKTSFTTLEAVVDVPDDGNSVWYLGFHVSSPAFRGWIYIKDIKIENAENGETVIIPAVPVVKSSTIEYLDYTAVVSMPGLDTAGNPLEENMDLRVTVDGTLFETKTACAPGADVDVALALEAGEHTIGYQAVLGSQASEIVSVQVSAQEHVVIPAVPAIRQCEAEHLKLVATVTMPTHDTEGNEISDAMSLKVSIDGTVVETRTGCAAGADVAVSRNLSAGSHTIGFAAVLNGRQSEEVSATVEAKEQTFTLPFTFNPSAQNLSQCVVIDVNNDGSEYGKNGKWTIEDNAFVYYYHSSNQADDWVILPMVDLGDVRKVKVSVDVKTGGFPEGFELKFGNARTIQAMSALVMKQENYMSKNEYTTLSAVVELPAGASSTQALGIHAISEADNYCLYIRNISIESAEGPVIVPAAPLIKTSEMAIFSYTATVTMPALDTDGNALAGDMTLRVLVDDNEVETRTACAPGSDQEIELTLEAGTHTIGYQAVLGEEASGIVSEEVNAASVATGQLPFSFAATQENFDQCEIIDLDGSVDDYGNIKGVWSFAMGNGFKYTFNPNSDADDWLILPMVDFGESTKVLVSVDVKTEYDSESFEIRLGRERTVEAMTLPVMERSGFVSKDKWTTISAEVEIPLAVSRASAAEWALGIHATSPRNHFLMYFDNIRIDSTSTTTGVEEVEIDEAAEPEYYNLQGIRVLNPGPGIYILRQGGKVTKVRL